MDVGEEVSVSRLDSALGSVLDLNHPLRDADTMAEGLVEVFARHTGTRPAPSEGEATLFAIDGLVSKLSAHAEGYPSNTVVGLGLLATLTIRELVGKASFVTHDASGVLVPVSTLKAASGFPALEVGNRVLPVARTVRDRWTDGEASVVDLWAQVQVQREAPVPEPETETDSAPLPTDVEMLKLASLAPFAGFLMVAIADGEVEQREILAFALGISSLESELSRAIVVHNPLEPSEVLEHLRDRPDLVKRSLAALGALYAEHPAGVAADREMIAMWTGVAGERANQPEERAALAAIRDALSMGRAAALDGPDPFPFAYDYEKAAFAPIAAFLMVAAADGEFEPKEAQAFHRASNRVENKLLQRLIVLGGMHFETTIQRMLADEGNSLAAESIREAGKLFEVHPDGPAARAALLAMLRSVASVHGEIRSEERRAIDAVEQIMDGREGSTWFVASIVNAVVLTGAIGVWYLLAAVSGAGFALPIALGIQGLLMFGLLLFSRFQSGGAQFVAGVLGSWTATAAMAVWVLILGAVFGGLPHVGLVLGGMGLLGLVWSFVLALFLRS